MEAARIRVLIGIPSYRRPDGLRRLLTSLCAQAGIAGVHMEIFVADNDATDREAAAVCGELANGFCWPLSAEVVEERGISAARNAILDEARASKVDCIAMIDDDEIAEPNWLSELLRVQASTGADVVVGSRDYHFEGDPSKAVRNCGLFRASGKPQGSASTIESTSNVLLQCEAIDKAGWPRFDGAFGLTGGGDTEFFARIRKRGFRFAYAPTTTAHEIVPAARSTSSWVIRRAFRVGNTAMRVVRMHGSRIDRSVLLAKALIILATAPLCAPLLVWPSRRLWIACKWIRSAGNLQALFGRHYHEYQQREVTATGETRSQAVSSSPPSC